MNDLISPMLVGMGSRSNTGGDYLTLGGANVIDIGAGCLLGRHEGPGWVSALCAADAHGDGKDEIMVGSGRGEGLLLRWEAERAR